MLPHIRDVVIDHNRNYLQSIALAFYAPVMAFIEGGFAMILMPLFSTSVLVFKGLIGVVTGLVQNMLGLGEGIIKLFAYGVMGYLRVLTPEERAARDRYMQTPEE